MAISLDNLRRRLNQYTTDLSHQKKRLREEKEALVDAESKVQIYQKAQQVVQDVAKIVQQQAHEQIAGVVSKCLSSVFEEPYEFKIIFEKKRKKTEARMVFLREGMEIDPLSSAGGGVIDVASFALRVACIVLSRPLLRKTIILDEPMKFVSAEYRDRIRSMIEGLSKELGIQFIMVTHIRELQLGKVIEIE